MANNCMLTTIDNPFDPFEDFISWSLYDAEKGYFSSNKLMRIAKIEDYFSEEEVDAEIERAIDEIIFYDPLNVFKKVKREYNPEDAEDSKSD